MANKSTFSAALLQISAGTFSLMQDHKRSTRPQCCCYIRLLYCKRLALGERMATSDLAMTLCHKGAHEKYDVKNLNVQILCETDVVAKRGKRLFNEEH